MLSRISLVSLLSLTSFGLAGCSSAPPVKQTGFISDYSKLQHVDDQRSRYVSGDLKRYDTFIIDPVEWRSTTDDLSPEDRAKIVKHFRDAMSKALSEGGLKITDVAGANTGRVRIAITNIHTSTWWMKIHPASSLAGAGRGGVACEGEVIDAVTGKQLAAFIRAGVGSQMTMGNFSTVSDVDNVIDGWAKDAAARLKELRTNE